jgi:cell shape-determining protein MreD
MKAGVVFVLTLVCLGLRVLLGVFEPSEGAFDPLLVIAVLAALPGRDGRAIFGGLLTGVVKDAWLARWYGQYSLSHLVIAFVLGRVAATVDLLQTLPVLISLVLATLADRGLQLLLAAMFGRPASFPGVLALGLALAGNVVLGWILLALARRWSWLEA